MDEVLKGLVLAEAGGLKKLTFIADSQTVYGWLGALLNNLKSKQKEDPVIQQVVEALEGNGEIAARSFHKVKSQLVVHNSMLQRSVKLLPNDVWVVPVIPSAMEERVLLAAHGRTGHAS